MITTRNGLVPSAIRSTERIGTTSTPSRRSTRRPSGQSSSRSAGWRSSMIRNRPTPLTRIATAMPAAAARIMSALVSGQERQPDDAGGQALQRRDPALGGLAAPDRLGLDDLGGGAGGNADERAADQRGEDDDRRRCRVPAARPELDDDALRRGRCGDERNRHRQRTSRAPRPRRTPRAPSPRTATSGIPIATRVPRDGSATPGAGRRRASWPRPRRAAAGLVTLSSSNASHVRADIPRSGEAGRENLVYRRFLEANRRRRRRSGARA